MDPGLIVYALTNPMVAKIISGGFDTDFIVVRSRHQGCRLWDDNVELFPATDAKVYRGYASGDLKGEEMDKLAFEQYVEKTREAIDSLPEGAYEFELRLQVLALQLLAEGNPVSPKRLARVWDMPLEQVSAIFEQAGAQGTLQLDDAGNMVGSAISLVPTNHKFQVEDKILYAWCAYDAIYVPGVIRKKAEIESIDPYSGEPIQLTISPDGEIDLKPEGIV